MRFLSLEKQYQQVYFDMSKRSEFTKRTYKTGEVAQFLQLHPQSVMRQDRQGLLKFHRNDANRRVMFREDLLELLDKRGMLYNDEENLKRDVIYCRVSSHEQKTKGDLDRQVVKVLEFAEKYQLVNPMILKEVGSGLNGNRKEMQKLLKMIINDEVNRILISYKDRLTRFGYHYLETICKEKNVKIHVAMVEDMMALIARIIFIYGVIYFSSHGIHSYIDQVNQKDWKITGATVTNVDEYAKSIGRMRKNRIYHKVYDIYYQYEVAGNDYTNVIYDANTSKEIGDNFEIKYNPKIPQDSTHYLKPTLGFVVSGTIGFIIFGIIGM